jgi:hypothetical protein
MTINSDQKRSDVRGKVYRAGAFGSFWYGQDPPRLRGNSLALSLEYGVSAKFFKSVYNYVHLSTQTCFFKFRAIPARVVKLVDAGDSKSPAARRAGSIPAPGTTSKSLVFTSV